MKYIAKLLIKVSSVLLIIMIYIILNSLISRYYIDNWYILELNGRIPIFFVYFYLILPTIIMCLTFLIMWISYDFRIKKKQFKIDLLAIAVVIFVIYGIVCIPYISYTFDNSKYFIGISLFVLSGGKNKAILQIILFIGNYFLFNSFTEANTNKFVKK